MSALPPISTHDASRRAFLRRSSLLSMAAGAAPWALTLSAMGDAAAQTADDYQGLRSNIAFTREALAGSVLTPAGGSTDGRAFALAPNLGTGLLPLFQQGRMAVLHNVGTLVQPTTREQYMARSVPLPR